MRTERRRLDAAQPLAGGETAAGGPVALRALSDATPAPDRLDRQRNHDDRDLAPFNAARVQRERPGWFMLS